MHAKLDENLPVEAVALFLEHGWDCDTVADEGLAGAGDCRIAEICRNETRVLFTLDLDFADIRAYPPNEYVGLVVLRPSAPSRAAVLETLVHALPRLTKLWTDRRLWIVEPSRIRVRGSDDAAL